MLRKCVNKLNIYLQNSQVLQLIFLSLVLLFLSILGCCFFFVVWPSKLIINDKSWLKPIEMQWSNVKVLQLLLLLQRTAHVDRREFNKSQQNRNSLSTFFFFGQTFANVMSFCFHHLEHTALRLIHKDNSTKIIIIISFVLASEWFSSLPLLIFSSKCLLLMRSSNESENTFAQSFNKTCAYVIHNWWENNSEVEQNFIYLFGICNWRAVQK